VKSQANRTRSRPTKLMRDRLAVRVGEGGPAEHLPPTTQRRTLMAAMTMADAAVIVAARIVALAAMRAASTRGSRSNMVHSFRLVAPMRAVIG
jgi:hypothetical protein